MRKMLATVSLLGALLFPALSMPPVASADDYCHGAMFCDPNSPYNPRPDLQTPLTPEQQRNWDRITNPGGLPRPTTMAPLPSPCMMPTPWGVVPCNGLPTNIP
jgi:hypothetical protein